MQSQIGPLCGVEQTQPGLLNMHLYVSNDPSVSSIKLKHNCFFIKFSVLKWSFSLGLLAKMSLENTVRIQMGFCYVLTSF